MDERDVGEHPIERARVAATPTARLPRVTDCGPAGEATGRSRTGTGATGCRRHRAGDSLEQVDQRRNDSRASAPLGRATSTRSPSSRARSAPAFHSVVVPMPASPPSTGARLETPATRKACNTPSYGSRPTTPNKCRTGPFLHVFHSLKLHSQHTCLPHHLPQAIARRSKQRRESSAGQVRYS